MAVFPCSRDYQFSPWDGVAVAFLGAGLTALAVTKLYKPNFFAQYKLPMITATALTPISSYAVGRILNWPKPANDEPNGRLEKHRESVDKWDAIRPDSSQPTATAEQKADMKTFLTNCSKGQIAAILHHHADDFMIVKSDVEAEKLADALEMLFDDGEGESFWRKIRGAEKTDPNATCATLLSSMHPATLAALLEAHPDDIGKLETAAALPLDAIVLLTSEKAMDKWIITKNPGDLKDPQIKQLFKEMLPPIPQDDIPKDEWQPDATPAFVRLISETQRFQCYNAISRPDEAMIVAILLGEAAAGEFITKTSLLSFGNRATETPTKETALKGILGRDRLDRVRGIVDSARRLLEAETDETNSLEAYMISCAGQWQMATLYALHPTAEVFQANGKQDLFRKIIGKCHALWTDSATRPSAFADILFGEKPVIELLASVPVSVCCLGIDFSRDQDLRVAVLRQANSVGLGEHRLEFFFQELRPVDRKEFLADIKAADKLVQALCEWDDVGTLLDAIDPDRGDKLDREVIIDYFRDLEGDPVEQVEQAIKAQGLTGRVALRNAIPYADLACFAGLLGKTYEDKGGTVGSWLTK